jgi:uncharacterized protein YhfF
MTWPRIDGLRTLDLGTPGVVRQKLVDLVLTGPKRGTAGLLSDYEIEGEELETVGERLVLIGDGGERLGLVEVTRVEVVPFGEVSDDFARSEGEGFTGHGDWAKGHRAFWERLGHRIADSTPIVCVSFALLP